MASSPTFAIAPNRPPEVTTLSPDFERGEEGLDLLLPVLHRQEDDEIENREDEGERNELDKGADLTLRAA